MIKEKKEAQKTPLFFVDLINLINFAPNNERMFIYSTNLVTFFY